MATKTVSFQAKVNNQHLKGNLLSDTDVSKLNTTIAQVATNVEDIAELRDLVNKVNQYDRTIATKDFYTSDAHKADMVVNVFYMVNFYNPATFVAPNESGEDFWPGKKQPDYYQLVRKDSSDTVHKYGKYPYSPDLNNFLNKQTDNEFRGYMMRVIDDTDVSDGDAVAYLTKFLDEEAGVNPDKNLYAGHIALDKDGKKLYAHTGLYKKDGTRQASLGVYKQDGAAAGEICLSTSPDGSQVTATAPVPVYATAANNEIATVKTLKDAIAIKPDVKYQASKPASEDDVPNNTIIFFDAENLLTE